jgi:heat-inducible transcriptional repressor
MVNDTTSEQLSPRRGRILKHVVEEYVVTAQPVSSDVLVRKYVPNVSSATVRNELAALEDFGYLYHPHTSSGRIPSDQGYRYYVEALMGGVRLSEAEERTIAHQFHQVEYAVGEWLRLAASVLSSQVRNLVMVAPPAAQVNRLRRVDLVALAHGSVLVVVISWTGTVRQQVVRLTGEITTEELDRLAHAWNDQLAEKNAAQIRGHAAIPTDPPYFAELREVVAGLLEDAERQWMEDIRFEGLSYIAAQPEFGSSERLQPVVEALERYGVINSLMEPLLQAHGLYVAIGQEQPMERLRECSVVLATYGRPDEMLGVVAVVGPTRLPYWRAVPMATYVAGLLDQLLEDTYLNS